MIYKKKLNGCSAHGKSGLPLSIQAAIDNNKFLYGISILQFNRMNNKNLSQPTN